MGTEVSWKLWLLGCCCFEVFRWGECRGLVHDCLVISICLELIHCMWGIVDTPLLGLHCTRHSLPPCYAFQCVCKCLTVCPRQNSLGICYSGLGHRVVISVGLWFPVPCDTGYVPFVSVIRCLCISFCCIVVPSAPILCVLRHLLPV